MYRNCWIGSTLVVLAIVALLVYYQSQRSQVQGAGELTLQTTYTALDPNNPVFRGDTAASTVMTTLVSNATTTTGSFGIEGAKVVKLNFNYYSTSTPVSLVYQYEFSNTATSVGQWYPETTVSQSGGVITQIAGTASSTTLYHIWTPITSTSTVTAEINVAQTGLPIGQKYMRLKLSAWNQVGTANQHIKFWGQAAITR